MPGLPLDTPSPDSGSGRETVVKIEAAVGGKLDCVQSSRQPVLSRQPLVTVPAFLHLCEGSQLQSLFGLMMEMRGKSTEQAGPSTAIPYQKTSFRWRLRFRPIRVIRSETLGNSTQDCNTEYTTWVAVLAVIILLELSSHAIGFPDHDAGACGACSL